MKKPLEEELEFIRVFTLETPKNYQLWQHRQVIVERLGIKEIAAFDLEVTKVQLSLDSKNIHCWQYRQWLLRHFDLPIDPEVEYVDALLKEDVYNNSAWNHRFFLIESSNLYKENKDQCLKLEISSILNFIDKSNEDNECFWNYLVAIIQESSETDFLIDDVISKLSSLIDPPETTENYLFLRFLVRVKRVNSRNSIYESLKELHPINRAFWTLLSHK